MFRYFCDCAPLSFLSYNPAFHSVSCLPTLPHPYYSLLSTTKHQHIHPFFLPSSFLLHKPNQSIHPSSLPSLSLFLSFLLLIIIFPLFIFCSFLPSFHNPNHYESFHSFIHPSFLLHLSIHLSFFLQQAQHFPSFPPSIHPSIPSFFPLPIFLSFFPSFISQTKPPTSIHTSSSLLFIYPSISFFFHQSIHPYFHPPILHSFLKSICPLFLFGVYISQNFSFLPPIPSFFLYLDFFSVLHPQTHPLTSTHPFIHSSFLPSFNKPKLPSPFLLYIGFLLPTIHLSFLFFLCYISFFLPSFYNPNTTSIHTSHTLLYPSVHPFSSTKPSSLIPSSFPFSIVYIYFSILLPSFFSS